MATTTAQGDDPLQALACWSAFVPEAERARFAVELGRLMLCRESRSSTNLTPFFEYKTRHERQLKVNQQQNEELVRLSKAYYAMSVELNVAQRRAKKLENEMEELLLDTAAKREEAHDPYEMRLVKASERIAGLQRQLTSSQLMYQSVMRGVERVHEKLEAALERQRVLQAERDELRRERDSWQDRLREQRERAEAEEARLGGELAAALERADALGRQLRGGAAQRSSVALLERHATPDHFIPLGSGGEVPVYLQTALHEPLIPNPRLSLAQTHEAIDAVWATFNKAARRRRRRSTNRSTRSDASGGEAAEANRRLVEDALLTFAKERSSRPASVTYPLMDAVERFRWDPDVIVFRECLAGRLDPSVRAEVERVVAVVQQQLVLSGTPGSDEEEEDADVKASSADERPVKDVQRIVYELDMFTDEQRERIATALRRDRSAQGNPVTATGHAVVHANSLHAFLQELRLQTIAKHHALSSMTTT